MPFILPPLRVCCLTSHEWISLWNTWIFNQGNSCWTKVAREVGDQFEVSLGCGHQFIYSSSLSWVHLLSTLAKSTLRKKSPKCYILGLIQVQLTCIQNAIRLCSAMSSCYTQTHSKHAMSQVQEWLATQYITLQLHYNEKSYVIVNWYPPFVHTPVILCISFNILTYGMLLRVCVHRNHNTTKKTDSIVHR